MNIKLESNPSATVLIGLVCCTIGAVVIDAGKNRTRRKIRKDELDTFVKLSYAEGYEEKMLEKVQQFEDAMENSNKMNDTH